MTGLSKAKQNCIFVAYFGEDWGIILIDIQVFWDNIFGKKYEY